MVGEGCEAGGAGLAVCNMGVYESIGWQVASEARCWNGVGNGTVLVPFVTNGNSMGREQEKVSQRVEAMLLPRLRRPPSAKLGAQAGKEGKRQQQEPEKPAHASPGFTLLTLV